MPNTPQKRRSKRVNQAKIRVFLSWSKSISKELASVLKTWLPKILQNVIEPYFSDTDIEAGDEWLNNLHLNLSETDCGIFCITDENLSSVWMHYEAGAMIGKDYICPFLFGVSKKELISPLNNRQCVEFLCDVDGTNEEKRNAANRKAFWKLVDRLSKICDNKGIETDKDTLAFTFNLVYDQQIKPALEKLGQKAQERKREAEREKLHAQTQADEIIAQAHAQANEIMLQAQEHYSRALSDVVRHSQSMNLSAPPGGTDKSGSGTYAVARNVIPDALEDIIMGPHMPLPVSSGFLEHCINVLSAFPPAVLDLRQAQKKDKDGKPLKNKDGEILKGEDGEPLKDKGRWEVIEQGRGLIDTMRSGQGGNKEQQVKQFQKLVKEKLSIPTQNDDDTYENTIYGSPISIKTIREALDAVILNILLCLGQERKEPT